MTTFRIKLTDKWPQIQHAYGITLNYDFMEYLNKLKFMLFVLIKASAYCHCRSLFCGMFMRTLQTLNPDLVQVEGLKLNINCCIKMHFTSVWAQTWLQ